MSSPPQMHTEIQEQELRPVEHIQYKRSLEDKHQQLSPRLLPTPYNPPVKNGDNLMLSSEAKQKIVVDSRQARQVIESQFNLEIRLKHNERRLIDQELAKCQAALEQLVQCYLVPHPTSEPFFSIKTWPAVGQIQSDALHEATSIECANAYTKRPNPDFILDGERVERH